MDRPVHAAVKSVS